MEKESLEDLTGDSGQNQAGKRGGNPLQDGGGKKKKPKTLSSRTCLGEAEEGKLAKVLMAGGWDGSV